ncbi:MAG TPA: LytR C-terminal domain-containing protein, partial [Acidimicrobiales bacterium]|nr:LytR C-terminal domain-containing protein [Acidimicrobiales bacterium]
TALKSAGFNVASFGTASTFGHTASVVAYGPGNQAAARTLAAHIEGKVQTVEDPSLTGGTVVLTTGTSFAGISGTGATTTTSTPSAAAPPAQTTLPPWDPTPCPS